MSKDAFLRILFAIAIIGPAAGASSETANFVVQAQTPALAKEIAEEAERLRRELAIAWVGHEFPNWSRKCPIRADVGDKLGAGGATSFVFEQGHVFGWQMEIQGSRERILDSVLPHEVSHTILATHFRRQLPRWLDEGACTTLEHIGERRQHQQRLVEYLKTGRGIPFSQMFQMMEYPRDILPLYAQGYSLARYLIEQKGRRHFVEFVASGLEKNDWSGAMREYYGYHGLGALQNEWLDWVTSGSPVLAAASESTPTLQASVNAAEDRRQRPASDLIYRAQSADDARLPSPANYEEKLVPLPPRSPRKSIRSSPSAAASVRNQAQGDTQPPGRRSYYDRRESGDVVLEWQRDAARSE
jgi:hypothetical protein